MASAPARIDRQRTTPFLLKLFYRQNTFHNLDEFVPGRPPSQHLQIYTWPSCSLRELAHLLTNTMPQLMHNPAAGTRIAFRLIYPDTRPSGRPDMPGRYMARELGSVVVGEDKEGAEFEGSDAERQLQDARFVIGDFVSCTIIPPLPNGSVAAAPGVAAGGPIRNGSFRGGPRGGGGGGIGGGFNRPTRGMRAFGNGDPADARVPSGEWRRGERLPEGPYGGGPLNRGRAREF